MAWTSAQRPAPQWPAAYHSDIFVPTPPSASDGPPRKRTKVDQACDQCRRRKRRCSAARPCFQCIEDKIACNFEPQISVKKADQSSLEIEQLTKQVQRCVEALETHEQKLHELFTRLQRFEDGGMVTQRTPLAAPYVGVCPQGQVEFCADPIKHSDYWPSVARMLAQFGIQWSDGHLRRLDPSQDLQASGTEERMILDSREPLVDYASHSRPASNCSSPVDLDCNTKTVHLGGRLRNALLRSYIRNMHVQHPIVDLKDLQTVWDRTWDRTPRPHDRDPSANGVVEPHNNLKRKRQRRRSLGYHDSMVPHCSKDAQSRLETALAYIVLALGAVCSEKEASSPPARAALFAAHVHSNGRNPWPISFECSSFGAQPADDPWRVMKTESDGSQAKSPLITASWNIPSGNRTQQEFLHDIGRQHHASAEKILRSADNGGADLTRAQLYILFGLFQGQMGNALKSMDWIRAAGQIVMKLLVSSNLLHPYESEVCEDIHENYRRNQRLVQIPEHDFIVLVAWSCIQLEGDILARRPVDPSGIRSLESRIPWPYRIPNSDAYARFLTKSNQTGETATGHEILVFYTSQLWIRKWVNTVCTEIYNETSSKQTDEQLCDMLRGQQSTLDCWRACLPEEIRWEDSDPSARDVLSAKLRATYWSAQYAISRVYLDHLLHVDSRGGGSEDAPPSRGGFGLHGGHRKNLRLLRAIKTTTRSEIAQCTERCVRAVVESLVAFDGTPHKLIATNIYGVAQAQFSSILVLLAVWVEDPKLIPLERLRSVLGRTIGFLEQHASEISQCATDSMVLQKVRAALNQK